METRHGNHQTAHAANAFNDIRFRRYVGVLRGADLNSSRFIALKHERSVYRWLVFSSDLWSKVADRANAWVRGIHHGRLPRGSRVRGTTMMDIGGGFLATGPVWIEAIAVGDDRSPKLFVGERVHFSQGVHIGAARNVRIGDGCLFGSRVLVTDHGHGSYRGNAQSSPEEDPIRRPVHAEGEVEIGDRCWLGDNVIVLPGTRLGAGCVVGAGAVLSGTFPAQSMVVGNPARIVKTFDGETGVWVRHPTAESGSNFAPTDQGGESA